MTSEIRDRIERAQSEDMETTIVDDGDPMQVAVDNLDSGTTHVVIPDLGFCSCEDHIYRDSICKHQIAIAMGDDRAAERMRQYFTDELKSFQSRAAELRSELREIESEREAIEAVREELDPVLDYSESEVGDDDGTDGTRLSDLMDSLSK